MTAGPHFHSHYATRKRGEFAAFQVVVWSITPFGPNSTRCGETLAVAAAIDDDLVAGVGQPVQGAVVEDGMFEESQPFVDGPVAGDDETGGPLAVEYQHIEIGRLLGAEAVQAQVVQDQQVGGQKAPEGAVQGVIHPGLGHDLEEVGGVAETDRVAGSYRDAAQGLGQDALADSGGADEQHMLVLG